MVRAYVPFYCLVLLISCGSAQKPPCEGVTCSSLCPAGSVADWSSDLARTCTVGADVEVAVPTQTGKGNLDTRCEMVDGVRFICRPVPGSEICGARGIASISRDRVECTAERVTECEDGQRSCTSDSQYIACHRGKWSPLLACSSDSRCFEGECVPELHVDCDRLPPFKACGGSLEGKWAVATSCMTIAEGCPHVEIEAAGSVSFNDAGRSAPELSLRVVATYPSDCANYDMPCRVPPRGLRCEMRSDACVCASDQVAATASMIPAASEQYCRRGNILDMSLGAERIRFVRAP